jgi:lauroyl/myristoyl acyltransferase
MFWYLVLRFATFLVRRLPPRRGMAVARWLGRVIYRFSPVAEAGRDNARHVLGPEATEAEVNRVARTAFEDRVLNYYYLLWLSGVPLAEISARAYLEGVEHVTDLVATGHGAVVVSGHIGPMEFMMQALTAFDLPLLGIVEHLEPQRLHDYVIGLRAAHGLELISTRASLIDVYRRVKRGEILLSMADRDSTGTGLIVAFFGEPAWVPDGYARLAVRAGVPVVFGFCIHTSEGAKGRIYPPIYPDSTLEREEAVRDLICRTTRLLEKAVRENPSAWHLSTPIWRVAAERMGEEDPA